MPGGGPDIASAARTAGLLSRAVAPRARRFLAGAAAGPSLRRRLRADAAAASALRWRLLARRAARGRLTALTSLAPRELR